MKNRLKNYGLWVAIASLVSLILNLAGVPIVPAQFDLIFNAVMTILVALGIISNPDTENSGFKDDPTVENNHFPQ